MGKIFFSAATGGFYHDAIDSSWPDDAKEITRETFEALMDGQAVGKTITSDKSGLPTLSEPTKLKLTDLRDIKIARIKDECSKRIETIAPLYKQINALRSGTDDVDFVEIDRLREVSNALEAKVRKMKSADVLAFDASDDKHWIAGD